MKHLNHLGRMATLWILVFAAVHSAYLPATFAGKAEPTIAERMMSREAIDKSFASFARIKTWAEFTADIKTRNFDAEGQSLMQAALKRQSADPIPGDTKISVRSIGRGVWAVQAGSTIVSVEPMGFDTKGGIQLRINGKELTLAKGQSPDSVIAAIESALPKSASHKTRLHLPLWSVFLQSEPAVGVPTFIYLAVIGIVALIAAVAAGTKESKTDIACGLVQKAIAKCQRLTTGRLQEAGMLPDESDFGLFALSEASGCVDKSNGKPSMPVYEKCLTDASVNVPAVKAKVQEAVAAGAGDSVYTKKQKELIKQ